MDIEEIEKYIKDIKPIAKEYWEKKQNSNKIGFNAFNLVSDLYYRENFHSDILCEILNPKGSHKEGNLFLKLFIQSINERLNADNYQDAEVLRENHKIDILIKSEKSEKSKHCIIIENKLYNAPDMDRQLPRYYEAMLNEGYTIDRIIYIPLNRNKRPDQSDWKEGDSEKINPLLTIMLASDLISWLSACQEKAKHTRSKSVIEQYIELIKFLTEFFMSETIEKFYDTLLKPENKKSVEAIVKMSNEELPKFMANKLQEVFVKLDYNPFSELRIHADSDFVINNFLYKDSCLTFDIWCYGLKGYEVILWDRKEKKMNEIFTSKKVLDDICEKQNGEITPNDKWIKSSFGFDQEKDVIEKVTEVIKYLRTIKD